MNLIYLGQNLLHILTPIGNNQKCQYTETRFYSNLLSPKNKFSVKLAIHREYKILDKIKSDNFYAGFGQ